MTQKIGLQERLLLMSESKNNKYDVELTPEDRRRLQNSLERDKLRLAGERSRERQLRMQGHTDMRASAGSLESAEYQNIIERMKESQSRSRDLTKSEPRFSLLNESNTGFRRTGREQSDLELSVTKSQIDNKYISQYISKPAEPNNMNQIRLMDLRRDGSQNSNERSKDRRKRSAHSKENRLMGMMDDWPSKFKDILAESHMKQQTFGEDVWVTDKANTRKEDRQTESKY